MFARSVTIRLKPNSVGELNKTLEKDILPLLQKYKGFRDEISLTSSNGTDCRSTRSARTSSVSVSAIRSISGIGRFCPPKCGGTARPKVCANALRSG